MSLGRWVAWLEGLSMIFRFRDCVLDTERFELRRAGPC